MDAHILRALQEDFGSRANFETIESVFELLAGDFHMVPGTDTFPVARSWVQRRAGLKERAARSAIDAIVDEGWLVPTGYAKSHRKKNRAGVSRVPATRYRWASHIRALFADARKARTVDQIDTVKPSKNASKNPSNNPSKNPSQLSFGKRKGETPKPGGVSVRPINPYPTGHALHQPWWDELARLDREWRDGGRKGPRPMSCEVGGSKKGAADDGALARIERLARETHAALQQPVTA